MNVTMIPTEPTLAPLADMLQAHARSMILEYGAPGSYINDEDSPLWAAGLDEAASLIRREPTVAEWRQAALGSLYNHPPAVEKWLHARGHFLDLVEAVYQLDLFMTGGLRPDDLDIPNTTAGFIAASDLLLGELDTCLSAVT